MFLAAKRGKLESEGFNNLMAGQAVEPNLKELVNLCNYFNNQR